MNRRQFLAHAGVIGATATLLEKSAFAAQEMLDDRAELTISDFAVDHPVPLSYTGLSYELAQLSEPDFFSDANIELVAYFRLLSPQGVLRLGGNSSEFCWLQVDAATPAPQLHVPTGDPQANWMPHRLFAIPPAAIDTLASFLKATGWRLIYGINFGNSTPERAALEAACVAAKIGKHLDYFQIGNEPDLYRDATNGTRPPGWGFDEYVKEWTAFADAISAKVPQARFGGPDVGATSDWIARFGQEVAPKLGDRLVALTGHYYAEGPPDDPRMTTDRLLKGDPKIGPQTQEIVAAATACSTTYRMTEGNSCYRGGKPDMSNAFASTLWAADYMLLLASQGCAGVNLHGGDSRFLTASLGDHTPGLDVAQKPQSRRGGFYTPISSEKNAPVFAMPIYYGMLFANQFTGCTFVPADLKAHANATAYAARLPQGHRIAVFNKGRSQDMTLSIRADQPFKKATAWRLAAPALNSTDHVTLAGAAIQPHAQWSPETVETLVVRDGNVRLSVPAASAVLVFVE